MRIKQWLRDARCLVLGHNRVIWYAHPTKGTHVHCHKCARIVYNSNDPNDPASHTVSRAVFWLCVVAFLLLVLTAGALDTERLFEREQKEIQYQGYASDPGCP